MTVVGVVADAKFIMLGGPSGARAYLPMKQWYRDSETLVVHTRGNSAGAIPQLREAIARIDPVPLFGVITMADAVSSGFSTSRTAAGMTAFFGVLALLIASVGLYAVVAMSVSERTREMGLRLALGATPRGIVTHLMRSGARLGAIGLAIGLVGAVAVARAMGGPLFGLSPSDPVMFVVVPLVLTLVVAAATWLPARRAARLESMSALRSE